MNDFKTFLTNYKLHILIIAIGFSLGAILLTCLFLTRPKEDLPVVSINKEPVSADEYLLVMSGLRSNVYSYFSQKYGAKGNNDFWKTSFNGEVPVDILKKQTIDELIQIKTEQILMKNNGLTDDISYNGFLQGFVKENERRKIAVSKNQPVYGPVVFEEKIYYEYLHTERREKLKKILASKKFVISEEETKGYYNSKREEFKNPDRIKIEKISLPVELESTIKKNNTGIKIDEIKERVTDGEQFQKVFMDYKSRGVKEMRYENLIFDETTYRRYNVLYPEISSVINNIKINEISDVITGADSVSIFKIVEKKTGNYIPYEEIAGQIQKVLLNEKYEKMITEKAALSEVIINEKVLMNLLK